MVRIWRRGKLSALHGIPGRPKKEEPTLAANRCPFCANYAYTASVGDAYRLDCRYCEIQIEITKKAYAARCPNPVATIAYIREKMKSSTRPRVDLADMKRPRPPLLLSHEEETAIGDQEQTTTPETDSGLLKATAQAIGTTLGKIAVKAGIVKPPAVKVRRKVAAKSKAPATEGTVGAKRKTASKRSPRNPARLAKDKK